MKVLIVTYRRADLLRRCVAALSDYFDASDLLIVDNLSDESESIAAVCDERGIALLRNDDNAGFAKAVNAGMEHLLRENSDPWVLLVNPDTELLTDPRALPALASAKSACLTTFDAGLQHPWDCEKPIPNPWRAAWEDAGFGRIRLPQPLGSRYRTFSVRNKGYLVGCFLLVSTTAWLRVGEFDERFWLYSEEADWCVRAYEAGWDCTVIPVLGYRHTGRQSAVGDVSATQQAEAAYRQSRLSFIGKHWGTKGIRTYTLIVSSLITARRAISATRAVSARKSTDH